MEEPDHLIPKRKIYIDGEWNEPVIEGKDVILYQAIEDPPIPQLRLIIGHMVTDDIMYVPDYHIKNLMETVLMAEFTGNIVDWNRSKIAYEMKMIQHLKKVS